VARISRRPAFEYAVAFLEHVHGKGVGLFTGGAVRTPDAQPLADLLGFFGHQLREDYFPQRVKLWLTAEQAGLADGDFVEQSPEFGVPGGR
jgi:hypothetical protein